MYDAVADTRYRYFPAFVVAHDKLAVASVAISSVFKTSLKLRKIFFKVKLKFMELQCSPFAFAKIKPAAPQSVATDVATPNIF